MAMLYKHSEMAQLLKSGNRVDKYRGYIDSRIDVPILNPACSKEVHNAHRAKAEIERNKGKEQSKVEQSGKVCEQEAEALAML